MKTLQIILSFVFLLIPILTYADPSVLTDESSLNYYEKMSYAKGYDIGKSAKKMVPDMNLTGLIQGLEDIITGNPASLSPQEEGNLKLTFANQGMSKTDSSQQKIDMEKLSYAFGLDIGRVTKKTLTIIDFPRLRDGVTSGFQDIPSILSPETEKKLLTTITTKRQHNILPGLDKNNMREEGEKFLHENSKKPGVLTTDSGLQYEILKKGNGEKPAGNDRAKVTFTASLLDGKRIDSTDNRGGTTIFYLNNIIKGLGEGLKIMNVGSKYKFFIPYTLAYGEKGAGTLIPAFSTLIYEVELLSILPKPPPPEKLSPIDAAQCSFDSYQDAGKCFMTLWVHTKPISGKDEVTEACIGSTTKEFNSECINIFHKRVQYLGKLNAKSANFSSFRTGTFDDAQHTIEMSVDERIVSNDGEEHQATKTLSMQAKKENNLWKISDCEVK